MKNFFFSFDEKLFLFINHLPHDGVLKILFQIVDFFGKEIFVFSTFLIFLIFLVWKKDKILIKKLSIIFLSILIIWMFSYLLKIIFARPRPFELFEDVILLGSKRSHFSFPSSHTTVVFGLFFMVKKVFENKFLNFFFFTLAILISFSRIYLGVHYPFDVFAGIFLGFFGTKILSEKLDFLYTTRKT